MLNGSQLKAIENINGPSLIIAGPGTGKTITLVYKIIEILKSNVSPENILALTFSNAASREIKDRVKKVINNDMVSDLLKIHTFHSFGMLIIKENPELSDISDAFSIIGDEEKESIMSEILTTDKKKIKLFIENISKKKQLIHDPALLNDEEFKRIFSSYNEKLKEYNLLDFDDLLYIPLNLFLKNNNILNNYSGKYRWILVDEYQDINFIQYELIKMLADKDNSNITVIGDPNQAIYGFRGASIKFIQNFTDDYKNAKKFILDKSYRCTDNILNASGNVISNADFSYLSGVHEGAKITINEFNSDKSEAEFIARKIESMIGGLRFFSMDSGITDGTETGNFYFSDFAVLTRVGGQMECLEKAFIDHSIPYQKIGESPFYNNPPFNELVSLLKSVIKSENWYLKNTFQSFKTNDQELFDLKNIMKNESLNKLFKVIMEKYFKKNPDGYQIEIDSLNEMTLNFNNSPQELLYLLSTGRSIDVIEKKSMQSN